MYRHSVWTTSALALVAVSGPAQTQGLVPSAMDAAVRPGSDFYAYANGAWERATPIPADRPVIGVWQTMQDQANARVRELIEQSAVQHGSRTGALYASYMDEGTIARRGIEPVRDLLDRIGQSSDRRSILRLMGELMQYDVAAPFRMAIGEDDMNPGQYVLTLSQGGLGMPNRRFYLSDDEKSRDVRVAYRTYVETLLSLTGTPRPAERATALLTLETALANGHSSPSDARDAMRSYNPRTLAALQAEAPGIDWQAFFDGMGIADPGTFIVAQPAALRAEAAELMAAPIETLRDFIRVRLMSTYSRYLGPEAEQARFAFHGTALSGATRMPPRSRQATTLVINLLGDAVGKAYVERYYTPATRRQMDQIVVNLVVALDRKLAHSTWLSPQARTRARAKLAATRFKIGAPERWPDDDAVEIVRDDLVGNVRRVSAARFGKMVAKLGRAVDRSEWVSNVVTPNAYASASANEVIFPAATLQPPLFDPQADEAFNYARIGATIGHELSHLFDDQGRKYDVTGRLGNWWTDADEAAFQRREAALARQYGRYRPFADQPIDGRRTVGENMADLAGLEIAYAAFRRTRAAQGTAIAGFTPDQRFFIAWAQMWQSRYRPEALRSMLASDAHAPNRERAWTVRNLDAWYRAFGVRRGEALYLAPADRITYW